MEAVAGLPITEGDNLIVFRATDKVHDVTCAFTITVDIRPPTLVCSSDIYSKSAVVNYPAPTCVDDRLGVKLEFLTPGLYSGAVFPYGKNVVKYRAVDQAGNEAFCQFSVVIGNQSITNFIALLFAHLYPIIQIPNDRRSSALEALHRLEQLWPIEQ